MKKYVLLAHSKTGQGSLLPKAAYEDIQKTMRPNHASNWKVIAEADTREELWPMRKLMP